ncbi:GNAT family N-acetyltransferase [Actinophytocola sp.]|uniref:GNAT family N-acetyltransferase n=1 Tax=Actinophytocola sp. TaxID=1872138 RepID=UPI003D6B66C0
MSDTLGARRFTPGEAAELAEFLTGEPWPFHSGTPDRAEVLRQVAEGHWDGPSARTFWLERGGEPAGVVRLFDLADGTPLFDLRLAAAHRGQGLGTLAVGWLTEYLFHDPAHDQADRGDHPDRQPRHALGVAAQRVRQGGPLPAGVAGPGRLAAQLAARRRRLRDPPVGLARRHHHAGALGRLTSGPALR